MYILIWNENKIYFLLFCLSIIYIITHYVSCIYYSGIRSNLLSIILIECCKHNTCIILESEAVVTMIIW